MQVQVSLTPDSGPPVAGTETAVVIDVLRATSVVATAMNSGATDVFTFREIEPARAFAATRSSPVALCGERDCQRIDGFEMGNSPAEYTRAAVDGKTLVLTTTNGTAAIEKSRPARELVLASFLNRAAVVEQISHHSAVHLVCAGTNGRVSNEDVLLAGAIVRALGSSAQTHPIGDEPEIAAAQWDRFVTATASAPTNAGATSTPLARLLEQSLGGKNLIRAGYEDDLLRCSQLDSVALVPTRVADTQNHFRANLARPDRPQGVN